MRSLFDVVEVEYSLLLYGSVKIVLSECDNLR